MPFYLLFLLFFGAITPVFADYDEVSTYDLAPPVSAARGGFSGITLGAVGGYAQHSYPTDKGTDSEKSYNWDGGLTVGMGSSLLFPALFWGFEGQWLPLQTSFALTNTSTLRTTGIFSVVTKLGFALGGLAMPYGAFGWSGASLGQVEQGDLKDGGKEKKDQWSFKHGLVGRLGVDFKLSPYLIFGLSGECAWYLSLPFIDQGDGSNPFRDKDFSYDAFFKKISENPQTYRVMLSLKILI